MRRRLGSVFVGVGAMALAMLGIPAATAGAAGHGPPAQASTAARPAVVTTAADPSSHATFTVTPTGTTVSFVGTTHFKGTETAVGGQVTATGSHPLPANLSSIPLPTVPNIGKGDGLAGTGGPRASAPHGAASGHLAAVVPQSVTTTPTAKSMLGINAYAQGVLHPTAAHPTSLPGVDVEPPDQGLCSNGTYTMEVNNMVMQLWQGTTALSTNGMALENLFTAPEVFGKTGTPTVGVNVQGDPRCQWDPASTRWFATQIWLTETLTATRMPTSPFGWAGTFVAVSLTTDPAGAWNVYFVPDMNNLTTATTCNNTPVTTLPFLTTTVGTANPCFGDQPLLGINGNTVFISTNEFSLYSATLLGAANVYFLSKADLLSGTTSTGGTPSPIYWAHPGTSVPVDTASVTPGTREHVWYSIAPAVSDGMYPATTLYAMSNVTYTTIGGTKVAEWAFTTTGAVTGGTTPIMGSVAIATTDSYTEPPMAVQKAGTVPLGTLWNKYMKLLTGGYRGRKLAKENGLSTNTDRMTTVAYDPTTGAIWGAMNSGVTVGGTIQAGIAWFAMTPTGTGATLGATTVRSGYVSAAGADIMFPSIAFTNSGAGLMDFSMSGPTMYPSTGYTTVTEANGPTTTLHVSYVGKGPQDGFTQYTWGYHTPRWGDYTTALASGTTFYFATEVIGQSCSVATFVHTFTCGGTRDLFANWGTSVNKLTMS